jgi:hypothetical protein
MLHYSTTRNAEARKHEIPRTVIEDVSVIEPVFRVPQTTKRPMKPVNRVNAREEIDRGAGRVPVSIALGSVTASNVIAHDSDPQDVTKEGMKEADKKDDSSGDTGVADKKDDSSGDTEVTEDNDVESSAGWLDEGWLVCVIWMIW